MGIHVKTEIHTLNVSGWALGAVRVFNSAGYTHTMQTRNFFSNVLAI